MIEQYIHNDYHYSGSKVKLKLKIREHTYRIFQIFEEGADNILSAIRSSVYSMIEECKELNQDKFELINRNIAEVYDEVSEHLDSMKKTKSIEDFEATIKRYVCFRHSGQGLKDIVSYILLGRQSKLKFQGSNLEDMKADQSVLTTCWNETHGTS